MEILSASTYIFNFPFAWLEESPLPLNIGVANREDEGFCTFKQCTKVWGVWTTKKVSFKQFFSYSTPNFDPEGKYMQKLTKNDTKFFIKIVTYLNKLSQIKVWHYHCGLMWIWPKEYGIEGRYNWRGPLYHMIIHTLQTVLHVQLPILNISYTNGVPSAKHV